MPRIETWLLCAVLIVLTVVAYLPLWNNGFVNFDDESCITTNPHVTQGLNGAGFRWAWTTLQGNYLMPITWLSFQFDAHFFSSASASGQSILSPSAFHGQNLFWHTASALLLFALWYRLTGARWRSFFVAMLFAVHPMHVESVAWAVERKDVLSGFFGILTIWAYVLYLRKPSVVRYLGMTLVYALSLLSKPMLITLPFLLLLLDYWPLRRMFAKGPDESTDGTSLASPASIRRLVTEKLPLFLMAAAVGTLTMTARSHTNALISLDNIPLSARLANALAAYGWYLFHTFWPMDLAALYPHPGRNWSLPAALAGAGTLVALSGWVVWHATRRRWLLVGWLWFIGVLVPVIGLAQGGSQAWADRFAYWPHIGLFVATAWTLGEVVDCCRSGWRVTGTVGAAVLGCLVTLTWVQVLSWRDTPTLWERVLAVTNDNALAHASLGKYYQARGQFDRAEVHLTEAVRIAPNAPDYHASLGGTLLCLGKLEEAVEHCRWAVEHDPLRPDVWYQLGLARLRQGNSQAAVRSFGKVLELQPSSTDALTCMGLALLLQGDRSDAIRAFRSALERDPRDANAWQGLGAAYLAQGQLSTAIDAFGNALQIKPQLVSAWSNLGTALGRRGQWYQAIHCHATAVRLHEEGERLMAQMNGRVPSPDSIPLAVHHCCRLAHALYQFGDRQTAGTIYQASLKKAPLWREKFTSKAARLSTNPDETARDAPLAFELVSQAIEASSDPSAYMQDTLAAALAALAQFKEAVQAAQQALQRSSVPGEIGSSSVFRR